MSATRYELLTGLGEGGLAGEPQISSPNGTLAVGGTAQAPTIDVEPEQFSPFEAALAGLTTKTVLSASATLTPNTIQPVSNPGTATAIAFTIPNATAAGRLIKVEREDDGQLSTAGAINLTGTFRGVANSTIPLVAKYESIILLDQGNGSWDVFGGHKTLGALDVRYGVTVATAVICQVAQQIGTGNYTGVPTAAIDGATPAVGMILLLTAEPLAVNNGLWVIQTGAWTRPSTYATQTNCAGKEVVVNGPSSINFGTTWLCTTPSGVIDTAGTAWKAISRDSVDKGLVNAYSLYYRDDVVLVPSIEARVRIIQPTQASASGTFSAGTYIIMERLRVWDPIRDFGGIAGADITVSLQAAVYAAANSGAYSGNPGLGITNTGLGGIVEIPDGFFLFGSTLANAAAIAQNAAIEVPSNVWIRGRGHSSTYLQLNYSSNCHGFVTHRSTGSGNGNAFYSRISDMTIDGRKGHQGTTLTDCSLVPGVSTVTSVAGTWPVNGTIVQGIGVQSGTTILTGGGTSSMTMSQPATIGALQQTPLSGIVYCGGTVDALGAPVPWCAIYHETNPYNAFQTGDPQFDPTHLFADLRLYMWQGDSIKIHGRSDCVIRRVKSTGPAGNSFTIDFDTLVTESMSESATQNALEMPGHSSNRVTSCKFYNSYERGIKSNGAAGYGNEITMTGNDIQQVNLDSLYLNGNQGVHFAGTISESGYINAISLAPAIGSWAASTAFRDFRTSGGSSVRYVNVANYLYAALTGGTSASSAPAWPTVTGNTVTDGTITWVCVGTSTSSPLPADVALVGSASYNVIDVAGSTNLRGLRIQTGCTGNDIRITQTNSQAGYSQLGLDSLSPFASGNSIQINGVSLTLPKAIYGNVLGDGTSGVCVFDGVTAIGGCTLAGSTYTLGRDLLGTTVTINSGVTVNAGGWQFAATGTFTNNGTITNVGAAGLATGAAPAATTTGSLGGGQAGAVGNTGAGSSGSVNGGAGTGASGVGGTGSSGAGGASKGSIYGSSTILRNPQTVMVGAVSVYGTLYAIIGGAAGAGGGGDGTNKGGSGGTGGGLVVIRAGTFINNGSILVTGGQGGTPTTGNAGGGGGGGGGAIIIYTLTAWTNTGSTNVAGGAAGGAVGTGTVGSVGSVGSVANYVLV
jgi:hypothetical protein